MWLGPGQTGTAVVTVAIPPNTEIGTKDKITFTSHGVGSTSQAAQLTVTSAAAPALVCFHRAALLMRCIENVFISGSYSPINLLEFRKPLLWPIKCRPMLWFSVVTGNDRHRL